MSPSYTDLDALQGCHLEFGEERKIGICVEIFIHWIANNNPPWAAYRVFMYGRLILRDKYNDIHSDGVRETWRRHFNKYVLKEVTLLEATNTCIDNQLCSGLKEEINGAKKVSSFLGS